MAGKSKTELVLVGWLAGAAALGLGCTRPQAEAQSREDTQQTQEWDEGTRIEPGTGGAGDAGSLIQEEDIYEPGTGGAGEEGLMEEPVRDEDEGVLQPGMSDEGLDHQDETLDTGREDTREQPEDS